MSIVKKTIFILAMLVCFAGLASAADVAAPCSYQLMPQIQVDSSGIFLDQVILCSNPGNIVPHAFLACAPRLGQTEAFSQNDIAVLARAGGAGLTLTNWTGGGAVRVSRRIRTLEDSDIVELLTAALQKEYVKNQGELELHLTRPWPRPQAPDEPLTVKIGEMPLLGVMPSFVVNFELLAGKERVGAWQVPLRASVWRDIPVAHSSLQRGGSLRDADVTMERADVLVERDVYMNFPVTDDTLELTEAVPVGRPILNRAVRQRPLVTRGEMVEGVYQDGALSISLMVETPEDGVLGQTVRVRNPKTQRELVGKVENEKTIRITL
jgi:flagella basal body P-ring formation protein FlgA